MSGSVTTYAVGEAEVLAVHGEFDVSNSAALERQISSVAEGKELLILDLSDAAYIDSSVLGVVIRTKKRLGDRIRLVLAEEAKVRRIFTATSLIEPLGVVPTVSAALDP
jgi:anti-anti-sigma factor